MSSDTTTDAPVRAFTIASDGTITEGIACISGFHALGVTLGTDPLTGNTLLALLSHLDAVTTHGGRRIVAPSPAVGRDVCFLLFERVASLTRRVGSDRVDLRTITPDMHRGFGPLWTPISAPLAIEVTLSTDAQREAKAALVVLLAGGELAFELPAPGTRHTLAMVDGKPALRADEWHGPSTV